MKKTVAALAGLAILGYGGYYIYQNHIKTPHVRITGKDTVNKILYYTVNDKEFTIFYGNDKRVGTILNNKYSLDYLVVNEQIKLTVIGPDGKEVSSVNIDGTGTKTLENKIPLTLLQ